MLQVPKVALFCGGMSSTIARRQSVLWKWRFFGCDAKKKIGSKDQEKFFHKDESKGKSRIAHLESDQTNQTSVQTKGHLFYRDSKNYLSRDPKERRSKIWSLFLSQNNWNSRTERIKIKPREIVRTNVVLTMAPSIVNTFRYDVKFVN